MSERSLILNGPQVRATLAGKKTQHRILVTDATSRGNWKVSELDLGQAYVDQGPSPAGNPGPYLHAPVTRAGLKARDWPADDRVVDRLYPRFSVGDRVWVRETWAHDAGSANCEDHHCGLQHHIWYRASEKQSVADSFAGSARWRPSIHMPRWAVRIVQEVTEVRAQRLQAISEDDAKAEGCDGRVPLHAYTGIRPRYVYLGMQEGKFIEQFSMLWDHINRKRATWASNPWVWALSFRLVS